MGQAQGHELPYDVGEKFTCLSSKSIWSVHSGKKKGSGENVTVFVFDHAERSPEEIRLAQAAHLRLKTLRHPNILKYIDGVELPTCIYVVTEEVVPLVTYISTRDGASEFSIAWGIHQVLKSINFLSKDCGLVHRNISMFSIFVDLAGEWKVGGVEFMHSFTDASPTPKGLEELRKYDPPETTKSNRRNEKWSTDMWGLGCLIWEVFNGPLSRTSDLKMTNKIPKSLIPSYSEMLSGNPKSRPDPSYLLESLREHGGFLASNFITIALRIEEVQIMEPMQRNEFFNELNKSLDCFPESFSKHKILPQLINAFEFGGAGSSVLAPLFKLGALLKGEEYQKKIVPCVVKLFSSTDRATRLNLLQQLEHFIDHLLPSTVNDQIFPHIAHGYGDTVPAIRELTVKATVLLAPKLNSATLNGPLLKHLAKCQLDEKPDIRVLTNICLGRIAGHLSPTTRQKVLVTAFLRALKDPFPPARIAAIEAMGATHTFYSNSDLSSRILPALCTVTVDKEKAVRDKTFKMIRLFLDKLEKFSEDPQAAAEQEKLEAAANSWTGWAMSSITSKFYRGSTQSQAMPSSAPKQSTTTQERQKESVPGIRDTGAGQSTGYHDTSKAAGSTSGVGSLDDWQEDEWEDVAPRGRDFSKADDDLMLSEKWKDAKEELEKDGSDMEGWEDDGWGAFDSDVTSQGQTGVSTGSTDPIQQPPATGADFFDSFPSTSKPGEVDKATGKDSFEDMWSSFTKQPSKSSKTTSPLPPASSLFGSSSETAPSKSDSKQPTSSSDGWDNWSEDFDDVKPTVKQEKAKESAGKAKSSPGHSTGGWDDDTTDWNNEVSGWDKEDSGWGSFGASTSAAAKSSGHVGSGSVVESGPSKQEQRQKKMEERRLKQQAARDKRAAGGGVKPGLGAVKRD